MNEKTDFDSYVKLSNFFASRHDRRREYEWKISFGFWALIIGATLHKSNLPYILKEHVRAGIVSGVIGLLFTVTWIRGVYVANEKDKEASFFYLDEATRLLRKRRHLHSENRIDKWVKNWKRPFYKFWFAFLFKWSSLFHFIVTLILIVIFNLVGP
jgi:ABC-type bacteriocin/lantibiotic exporter with double-glycine peptidase domain